MIYVILGPTGSGKTRCVDKIFPRLYNPIIINADAFQVYKDMNIGTAKIEASHPLYKDYKLLDFLSPEEVFSIQEYQSMFRLILDKAIEESRDVIIVGGSGLYVKSSLYDYDFVDFDNEFDATIYENKSNEELHKILVSLDEEEGKKIHPNNRKRVLQAIRIASAGKGNKSSLIAAQKHEILYKNVEFLCLNPDREELYNNINKRVDEMVKAGLVDEVKHLLDTYKLSQTAYQAIGYKEIIEYLSGSCSLDDAIETIKKRTRNYAKRQMTFFRHQLPCVMFKDSEQLILHIIEGGKNNEKRN